MRKKERGGESEVSTKGDLRKKSGALIREMQGVDEQRHWIVLRHHNVPWLVRLNLRSSVLLAVWWVLMHANL